MQYAEYVTQLVLIGQFGALTNKISLLTEKMYNRQI